MFVVEIKYGEANSIFLTFSSLCLECGCESRPLRTEMMYSREDLCWWFAVMQSNDSLVEEDEAGDEEVKEEEVKDDEAEEGNLSIIIRA